MAEVDLSVCIVSHNSRDDLETCLTHIGEVMPSDLAVELIVVDNTGSDGSADLVRKARPDACVILNETPRGFGANINQAVAESEGQYLLIMNPDVILRPGAVEAMVEYLDNHPDVGACGPKTLYPDGSLQATCRRFPKWTTVFWRWLRLDRIAQPAFYQEFLMLDCDHDEAQAVDWIMGSCMLVRCQSFAAVGGFDEGFFLYYEDIDFCRRLWQGGIGVHYVPDATVTHAYQRTSGKSLFNAMTLVHLKSILRYRRKHGLVLGELVARRSVANLVVLLILLDLIVTQLALQLARYARLWFPLFGAYPYPNPSPLNELIYAIVPVIWLVVFSGMGLYRPEHIGQLPQQTWRVLLGVMLSGLVLAGSLYALFLQEVYMPRLLLAYFLVFNAALMITTRALFYQFLSRNGLVYRPRLLLVGNGEIGRSVSRWIRGDGQARTDLIGTIPWPKNCSTDGASDDSEYIADTVRQLRIDEIVFTPPLPRQEALRHYVNVLQEEPVEIKIVPDFLDLARHHAEVEDLYGVSAISLRSSAIRGGRLVVKRLFDLVISIPLLILSAPGMLLIAVAVRLDSPGPAIFRQERVGENGRLFCVFKFRSMVAGAEGQLDDVLTTNTRGELVHKTPSDPRVTRVGRSLRRWSLDELPQLWNVIRGEMSLVGPRPELPFLVAQYEDWQYKRLAVPPGMTGWWQIRRRSQTPMHLAIEEDLFYIEHYSVWLDLRILIETIWAVLSGKGAY